MTVGPNGDIALQSWVRAFDASGRAAGGALGGPPCVHLPNHLWFFLRQRSRFEPKVGGDLRATRATSESRKVARLAGAIGFDPVFGAEHRQYHRINALRGQVRVRSLSPGTAMVSAMLPSQPLRTQCASSRFSLPRFVKRIGITSGHRARSGWLW